MVVAGVLTLVITQFVNGFPDLAENSTDGIRQIQDWLRDGPLNLSTAQLTGAADAAQNWVDTDRPSRRDPHGLFRRGCSRGGIP